MHDRLNGGRSPWPTPSPADILIERIDRLGNQLGRIEGRVEMGFEMTERALTHGFRKSDHAHARITELKGRVERLEVSGPPPTDTPEGSRRGLMRMLTALLEALPPLSTLALLIAWLTVALTVGIKAEMVQALIGLGP